jgi:hypothetical protein
MAAILIAVITTLIGIVVAILAARHYYRRSAKHRLAIYYLPSPSIFSGVDPEIRRGLSIKFRDETVQQLSVVEFLIANEGADPIRESIEPLTCTIGEKSRIVDVTVTYVQPEGRSISAETVSDRAFKISFPLLNPSEYFYIKLIVDGPVDRSKIKCTITADNLPPTIDVESAAGVSFEEDSSSLWALIPAVIFLAIGAVVVLPMVGLYHVHPGYFPFAWSKFKFVWWLTIPLLLGAITSALFVVIGLVFSVIGIVGDIPRRRHFKGPGRPYRGHFASYAYGYSFADMEDPTVRYPREL